MIFHFRDSIWYATRINSIGDADHICNGVKPQSFVFVCTEHLKCLPTKIFGIGLKTSCLQLPFQRQLKCKYRLHYHDDNIIVAAEFRETNPVQTYIIRMGIKKSVPLDYFDVHLGIYDNVTSRYP